jgi:hemoglobin-like flavoprotein
MKDYIELFTESYKRVLEFKDEQKKFLDRFYELFFTRSPEIARLFRNTNMSAQKTMLQDSLFYMKEFFISKKDNEYLRRVAKVHSQSGHDIPAEFYDVWLDTLIETVKEYDSQFNEDVELAWRIALSPGITYMKHMHDKM